MKDKVKMRNKFIFSISPNKYVYLYKEKISKAFIYILVLSLIIAYFLKFSYVLFVNLLTIGLKTK